MDGAPGAADRETGRGVLAVSRAAMLLVALGLALALAACSFVHEQIGSTSTGACIRKECRDPDAKDYTQCEAACRQRYQYQR